MEGNLALFDFPFPSTSLSQPRSILLTPTHPLDITLNLRTSIPLYPSPRLLSSRSRLAESQPRHVSHYSTSPTRIDVSRSLHRKGSASCHLSDWMGSLQTRRYGQKMIGLRSTYQKSLTISRHIRISKTPSMQSARPTTVRT